MEPEAVFAFMMDDDASDMLTFVTEHMMYRQVLKKFGHLGVDAIMKELEQLVYSKVMDPRLNHADS